MINIIETMANFTSVKIMQKSMKSSLDIKYIENPVEYKFDKNKSYFLYMHIPFCQEFCTFCTFHKFKYEDNKCKAYFKTLKAELLKAKEQGFQFHTLYIGGGTPLIDEGELIQLIELAKKLFDIKEVSCESTPSHIDPKVIKNFDGLIDRLSIGVQTFDDQTLKDISRYDKYGSSEILQERLSNIIGTIPVTSLDLIFNLAGQTPEMLRNDLEIAKKLKAEQITTYPLMSSQLANVSILEHLKILKNSKEYDFYNIIREELSDYSLNNAWSFSKDNTNMTDEYTVNNSEYIGLGSGGFTYIDNQLFINAYDLNQYDKMINENSNAIIALSSKFTPKKQIQYQFLLHLFGGTLDIEKFNSLFNVSVESVLRVELFMMKSINAIYIKDGIIYPTRFGEFITVVMMREFYTGMDNIRSMLRKSIIE
ncbi:MAG: coproporphyrinogen III oxidase-like Fe-S oxidoreductase [Sulfurimonas sp.]|jgi:coproporphyrinogen III oxidase-like Fe-S oxidoreductase